MACARCDLPVGGVAREVQHACANLRRSVAADLMWYCGTSTGCSDGMPATCCVAAAPMFLPLAVELSEPALDIRRWHWRHAANIVSQPISSTSTLTRLSGRGLISPVFC